MILVLLLTVVESRVKGVKSKYCSLKLNSMPDYRLQSTGAADGKNQEAFEHWS